MTHMKKYNFVDDKGSLGTAEKVGGDGANAVLVVGQTLTDAQKAQARENIEADESGAADAVLANMNDRFVLERHEPTNWLDPDEVGTGYYWTDGYHSSSSYVHTGLMPVTPGETYSHQYGISNRALISARYWVFYAADGNTAVGSASSKSSQTAPAEAAYVRISYNETSVANYLAIKPAFVKGTELVPYSDYFEPYTDHYLKSDWNNDAHIKDVMDAYRRIQTGLRKDFSINSNTNGMAEELHDMFGYSIQFRGTIDTFNGLVVAHGYNQPMGGHVKVTPTMFEYYQGTDSTPVLSEPHGLTFADYIAIRIDAKPGGKADFAVYTNGGAYTKTNQDWDVRKGQLSVRSVDTNVLTDCVLSYNCAAWRKPIQMYGDSYFGIDDDRWTYYLRSNGMDNCLVNGYPGRQSEIALTVAKIVLAHSNPEIIVWCLGMNDGDTGGAVNANWKSCLDELEEICATRGIELILATIPNVPTVDNTCKNAVVRASGHRYIDFAEAVGAASGTTWYTGMLSSDGVHPSAAGAVALFNRALADVPELMG